MAETARRKYFHPSPFLNNADVQMEISNKEEIITQKKFYWNVKILVRDGVLEKWYEIVGLFKHLQIFLINIIF